MNSLLMAISLALTAANYQTLPNQATTAMTASATNQSRGEGYEVPAISIQKAKYDAKALDCGYHINQEIHKLRTQQKSNLTNRDFDSILSQEWRKENCSRNYGYNTSLVLLSPKNYLFNISHKSGSVIFSFDSSGLREK